MPPATVRLHLIRTGTLRPPPGWFVRGSGPLAQLTGLGLTRARITAPVISFAIEHPAEGLVLIDAGLHPSVAESAAGDFGRFNAFAFSGMRATATVPGELRARGLAPEDIRTILMTHMHVDHASGLAQFPDAEVVVSGREWEAAMNDGVFHGYHRPQFAHVAPRLVDPREPADGFERTLDVFGDGSVRLAFTPGHTHGHCSLVVRTARGPVLVAGDAIYTLENLDPGRVPLRMEDARAYRRSVEQINAFRALHPDAPVIPGHDEAAWRALEPVH